VENYSFSDLITFTRTTNATLVDGTGRVTYAPNNLFTNSEAFDAGFWFKSNATVTANVTAAPNGTTTADAIIENTATATHGVNGSVSVTAGVSYALSVYAKQNGRSLLRIGSATTGKYAVFDLNAGVVQYVDAGVSASITSVGNGWYRCTATQPETATGSTNFIFRTQSNTSEWPGTGQYTGDGVSGVFLWGAQVEAVTYQTTPGTYNSTSPPNLLGFTQEFDNAGWTKAGSTITANATTSPDDTLNADKLVEDSSTGQHRVQQAVTTVSGTSYTYSVYLKAGERTVVTMRAIGTTTFAACTINLTAGTISSVTGVGTITNAGNGWYRVSVTGTADSTTSTCYVNLSDGGINYTGNGSSGAFLWGAQLSNSASVDPYVYNPAAAPTSTAYYGPRFDYNPATLAPRGLLIEEQRVNLATYSQEPSNAAWSKIRSSITADVMIAPDGTLTGDKLVEDTSVTNTHRVSVAGISMTSGTSYTWSIFLKAGERTSVVVALNSTSAGNAFTTNPLFFVDLLTGAITSVSASVTASSAVLFPNGWWRVSVSATATLTTTNFPTVLLAEGGTNAYTGDGVSGAFLWGGQVEAASFPTSYIPTVASTVTRAADIAVMSGSNFSTWYNQSQGTMVAFFNTTTAITSVSLGAFGVSDGTSNERLSIRRNSSDTNPTFFVVDGGVAQYNQSVTAASGPYRSALAYANGDYRGASNGTLATAGTGTVPTVTQAELGFSQLLTRLNGHLQSITYYPYRLADFQLQALTS